MDPMNTCPRTRGSEIRFACGALSAALLASCSRATMDDEGVRHRSKKSKHEHKHKRHKSDKRHHHGSDSDDEERPLRPPQVQAEPWHCMQFELIDGVNDYGQHEPDSRVLRGLALTSAPNVYDMSDFTRLVSYARETFEIDPELAIVLSVPVRACFNVRSRALACGIISNSDPCVAGSR